LRLARAFTGKPLVLKFEGAYHGAHDVGVVSLFPSEPPPFPQAAATSAGLAPHTLDDTLVAPFNNLAATSEIITQSRDRLAAVIVEPFHRCLAPEPGFLTGLRKLCDENGVLLIFDEVVTGFRLAYGGAQEYYGVVPDLVAYGKALGGGYPIGTFGGRRELMQQVREDRLGQPGYVWTASTLGGNPVSCAAALAALAVLARPGTYERLHRLGNLLRDGMRAALAKCGLEAQVIGDGPLAQFVLSSDTPRDYRSTRHRDPALARRLMLGLFAEGIFLNPMGTKLYLSIAHDERVCGIFLERFERVLHDLR
jgi:glutamate-1-semialdehyde 2,1-aminomutase